MSEQTLSRRLGCCLARVVVGTPVAAALGWIGYSHLFVPHTIPMPPAVSGTRKSFHGQSGTVSYYVAGPQDAPPLLLIHSINAAASSYEVRPIFEHYRQSRRVYAIDLPGFGFSERSARTYTPRLYTNAILDMMNLVSQETDTRALDVLALSLGCEFAARAASEHPDMFRTLAMVTPSSFRHGKEFYGEPGSTRGNPLLHKIFMVPFWSRPFFDLLNSRPSQHYFLKKTFGTPEAVDEGLLAYDYISAHQKGARFAPYAFVSGALFSADIDRIYDSLRIPVWVACGTFGQFSNVDTQKVAARGWTTQVFPTGGFPHFDQPEQFSTAYDAFLAKPVKPTKA